MAHPRSQAVRQANAKRNTYRLAAVLLGLTLLSGCLGPMPVPGLDSTASSSRPVATGILRWDSAGLR